MSDLSFKIPQDEDIEVVFEGGVEALPEAVQTRLLEQAVRSYVIGRCNVAKTRYDAGLKAHETDPTVDKPTVPDYAALATSAKNDLLNDTMRKRGDGTSKSKADPIESMVTQAVVRELFESRRKKDKTVKFGTITREVSEAGGGLKYLQKKAGNDADKLKKIETKYLKPARAMLGLSAKGEKVDEGDDLL